MVGGPVAIETSAEPSRGPGVSNSEPFEMLLERCQDELFRYAIRLTGNRPDAEDLYQESLLKAFRAFDDLTDDSNTRAWLYRIVTNTFLSGRRKLDRERPLAADHAERLPARSQDEPARIDAGDLLVEVEARINGLPEKQRIALMLRKLHEFGYVEIAEMMESSEDAARANVYAGLKKLRQAFGDRVDV